MIFSQLISVAREGLKKTLYGLRVFFVLPNIITTLRVLAVWPIAALYNMNSPWAFWVYIGALFTDYLDGRTAKWLRKNNSAFGRLYDPFADKVLHMSLLLFIFLESLRPLSFWYEAWVVLTFVLFALPGFKTFFKIRRRIGANIFGKIKLCCEGACFCLLFLQHKTMAQGFIIMADIFALASIIGHLTIKEQFSFKASLQKYFP